MNKEYIAPIAYFSMEIAIDNNVKTYAGGLGVLAGDILRSAAGKKFNMIGITLVNRYGYFKQKINNSGTQIEMIDRDYDFSLLKKLDARVEIKIGEDVVKIGAWQYLVKGPDNFEVPIFFLDTNISGNKTKYKRLTNKLYGGDLEMRLQQEIILGRGGVKMIKALGYDNIKKYHLNEGHGAFAAIELFSESKNIKVPDKISDVKNKCVFTTHTPIQTIFDEFPLTLLSKNQIDFPFELPDIIKNKKINTLDLAMFFSGYINGVALTHQKFLNDVFPQYKIKSITNGVNSVFWTSPEFTKIFSEHIPGWKNKPSLLKKAEKIPDNKIWSAHQTAKRRLLDYIKVQEKVDWSEEILTICFARRFTQYKQPLLIFSDIDRLLKILEDKGRLQIILAGKAHFRDLTGQNSIKKLYSIKKKYPQLNIIFLKNYNLDLAQLLVAGSDLWLNNPQLPQEACGTSGMKAAHNGVPQVSTLDGWWPEGYKKNKTGWAINNANDLYEILRKEIIPLYYETPEKWVKVMKNVISLNASYFNSDRALDQYIHETYK
ncbi:MAG: alpha-glucan family phosphorylase [Patescibacteria group bacterium]